MNQKVDNINSLSDDCIVEILSQLTDAEDLLNVEKVCRKWRDLVQYSWLRKKKISIAIKNDFQLVEKSLLRCGRNITHLSAASSSYHSFECKNCSPWKSCSSCTNQSQIRECFINLLKHINNMKNLKELNLGRFCGWYPELRLLSKISGENLTYICFWGVCNLSDEILERILSKAQLLEALVIKGSVDARVIGTGLLKLSAKCKHLHLRRCRKLRSDIMRNVFKRLPNLEKLVLVSKLAVDLLLHQTNLVIFKTNCDFNQNGLNIPPFFKVKTLELSNKLTRKNLHVCSYLYPNVKRLHLNYFSAEFGLLANFEHLEVLELSVSEVNVLNSSSCKEFSNLKVLDCSNHTKWTWEGLKRVISLCPKLESIKLECKSLDRFADRVGSILIPCHSRQLNFYVKTHCKPTTTIEEMKAKLKECRPSSHTEINLRAYQETPRKVSTSTSVLCYNTRSIRFHFAYE